VPALPDSLAVLRRRDLRLLLGAQGASVLGDRMVAVALAFAVLEVGGSASQVGLVLACGALPMVVCVLAGGVVADRTSRRTVMVAADLVRLASQGTSAALLVAGAAEVWTLAALAAVTGAASGFFNPASTGLLPVVVPPEDLAPANGLRASAVSGGEIAGPLLAGVIVAAAGAGWALAADAVTFAVSAALLVRLRLPRAAERAATTFVTDLREGWTAFRSRRWLWSVVIAFTWSNLMWGAWSALGPVVADRSLGGAAAWGTVLGATGVGALAGSALAVRARPRRPLVLFALTELVFALPLAVLAAAPPVAVLAAATAAGGAAMMLGTAVWETTLQRLVPAGQLSRVASYDWFGSMVSYPVGLAMWGPIAAVIGLSSALWLAFVLQLAAGVALLAMPAVRGVTVAPAAVAG
jgi:MFS family permease